VRRQRPAPDCSRASRLQLNSHACSAPVASSSAFPPPSAPQHRANRRRRRRKSGGDSSSFSPCGRRWREAPDEGYLSANSRREIHARRDTPHPPRRYAASHPLPQGARVHRQCGGSSPPTWREFARPHASPRSQAFTFCNKP
jgi:hypothetical protein